MGEALQNIDDVTTLIRVDANCYHIEQEDGDGSRHLVVFSLEDVKAIYEAMQRMEQEAAMPLAA